MKKYAVLLSLCMGVFLALLLSACVAKCEHQYTEKVIQKPTCVAEGTKTYTCSLCNDSYTEVLPVLDKHDYDSTVVVEANCTSTGERSYKCNICGHSYKEEIPTNTDHEYSREITLQATCNVLGQETLTCVRCGNIKLVDIPKLSHVYDEGTIIKKPSLSAAGTKQYACTLCGNKKEEQIPKIDIKNNSYKQGVYHCPTDLPEGDYILISETNSGYFALCADAMCNDILTNDNFGPVCHIRVVSGVYLELSRCIAVPYSEEISFDIVDNGFISGTYKVGKDIPAGKYKLTAISGGYYAIYNKPHGDIVANDFFGEGSCYITLKKGQYVEFSSVKIQKG